MSTFEERLESFVMSRPSLAQILRRRVIPGYSSQDFWEKGRKRLVERAKRALSKTGFGRIPAYRQFVLDLGLDPNDLARRLTTANFSTVLPIIDKKSYSVRYHPEDRCIFAPSQSRSIVESSGTTGEPVTYYKTLEELEEFERQFEVHLLGLGLGQVPLFVNLSFAFGIWPSGRLLTEVLRIIMARRGFGGKPKYALYLATPGADTKVSARVLTRNLELLSRKKGLRALLPGYPPTLKTVLELAKDQVDLRHSDIYLAPGGEGYTIPWLLYVARELLGFDPWEGRNLDRIRGGYGAVDIGSVGSTETPLTGLTRLLAWEDKALCRDLFEGDDVPTLTQAIPTVFFPEVVDGEAIVTTGSAIRYNIHDRAKLLEYPVVINALRDHGYDPFSMLLERGYEPWEFWKAPFLVVHGRSDGTVSFGGALVYPSNVAAALNHPKLASTNTGNFRMQVLYDESHNLSGLEIVIEIGPGVVAVEIIEEEYRRCVLQTLLDLNAEFADSYEKQRMAKLDRGEGDQALFVKLRGFGSREFAEKGIKFRYT